ncbi:PREDICTED: uncharacterized protein LOC109473479 [Branchiostoma belcheri]|uniref:Uncharacterized protein LOC109473479 n=1 Tax=Branchiostoma belcheri TaxID=7741 RepID=A0A6P4YHU3_BRABE|nr:PREDICTED: uncharacterized protein LOC109473479 [Branchiostoma belcheri]
MGHPIILALTIAVLTPALMTSARPTYFNDLSRKSSTDDDILGSITSSGATALLQASGSDQTKGKSVATTEDILDKFLQLNNIDRSEGEVSSDGLLARLAQDRPQYSAGRGDAAVHSRRTRSVTDEDVLPEHYRRHISLPPIPFDDGNNVQGRSVCPWRYEDDTQANRFPHTLRVAVKTHTGSRCIDPATGAPRADLRCLPVEYKLNVLRKDSEGVWQISSNPEFVTVGYTCARSRTA